MATAGHQYGVAHEAFSAPFMAYAVAADTSKMLIQGSNHRLPVKPTTTSERNPVITGLHGAI